LIDSTDINTVRAVRVLFEQVKCTDKPIVFWFGAGTSSWCGYSRWPELADIFHDEFVRYEPRYDAKSGLNLLQLHRFPELFQACKDVNSQRFYRLLLMVSKLIHSQIVEFGVILRVYHLAVNAMIE
jgi:hypothetical protein